MAFQTPNASGSDLKPRKMTRNARASCAFSSPMRIQRIPTTVSRVGRWVALTGSRLAYASA